LADGSAQSGRIARRIVVTGRVQGVWYRGWTVDEARKRTLDGWVRNRRDGTVEALFAGPKQDVLDMIDACQHGPPSAQVISVDVTVADDPGQGAFRQRQTG